jgi:hypothetical protein
MFFVAIRFELREGLVNVENGVEWSHDLVKQKHHSHDVDLVAHHVHHEGGHCESRDRTLGCFHGTIMQYFLPIHCTVSRASIVRCKRAADGLQFFGVRMFVIVTHEELFDGGGHLRVFAAAKFQTKKNATQLLCCNAATKKEGHVQRTAASACLYECQLLANVATTSHPLVDISNLDLVWLKLLRYFRLFRDFQGICCLQKKLP